MTDERIEQYYSVGRMKMKKTETGIPAEYSCGEKGCSYSVCYVLTEKNGSRKYFNQMLVSIASLRYRSFTGRVYVVADNLTAQHMTGEQRDGLKKYQAETVTVDIPDSFSAAERSRYLKTSLREYITGDFLYLDTDTVFADQLPEQVSEAELALVQDQDDLLRSGTAEKLVPECFSFREKKEYLQCGYDDRKIRVFYNGGVIWSRDTEKSHLFFREWHKAWLAGREKGVMLDQPSLNETNRLLDDEIEMLDGIWNVQVTRPYAQKYIDRAIILHYFNSRKNNVYLLGYLDSEEQVPDNRKVQAIIESPRDAFLSNRYLLRDGVTEEVLYSKTVTTMKYLYQHHLQMYRAINYALSLLYRIMGGGKAKE